MGNVHIILVVAIVLCAEYLLVLLAIACDLRSGVKKAKKRGEPRCSHKFRRTIEKIARYYNALFALTIIDLMHMVAIYCLNTYYGYNIPVFPIVTLVGALSFGAIEVKSILEKAEDKVKFEHVGDLAGKIIMNKGDMTEICKAIIEYLKKEEHESK